MVSRILNALIFLITAAIVPFFFRKDGKWSPETARKAFRYFTVLSNVLCALTALILCLFPAWHPAWLLKYLGTAAVTLTLMTVLCYLGPAIGYKVLLEGYDLFLHLITPLLAIVSFCFFEKRGMGWGTALLGVIPMLLYAFLYLYHVILAPEPKRWEDFYGFNRGGHWKISFAAMLVGMLLICFGLMALQNL
nr:hypothetical protein [Lachnospiraceae bacterium]